MQLQITDPLIAPLIDKGALLSPCQQYRYGLWRIWNHDAGIVCWIGLNPSTADAALDDPTIRRCIDFTRRWGYGGLYMVNLFAFRATKPTAMFRAPDPIGPHCDQHLLHFHRLAAMTIAAWGVNADRARAHRNRAGHVAALLTGDTYCLRRTKHGHPEHPLFVPATTTPIPFVI